MSARVIAELVAVVAAIALVALLLQPLATRLRLPDPLLFLGLGVALGVWTDAQDAVTTDVVQIVGTVALVAILADGGLRCGYREFRRVLAPVIALGVVGTVISFVAIAGLAHEVADLEWPAALILGAVLAPTDPAAVFSALAGQVARVGRIGRVLEGEAGLNDPIAIALAVEFVDAYSKEPSASGIAVTIVVEGGVGVVVGVVVALGLTRVLGPLRPTIHAAPALAIFAGAGISFGGAVLLHGSGFIAAYLFGLVSGDREVPERADVIALHAELAHLGEIAMFVLLGVVVTTVDLGSSAVDGVILALAIMLVVRPVVTFPALTVLGYSRSESLFGSLAGLRGAVPILLASLPVAAGVPEGETILALTAVVVFGSLVVQGIPLPRVAERLHLQEESKSGEATFQ
jgi:cell volume regulation protein A